MTLFTLISKKININSQEKYFRFCNLIFFLFFNLVSSSNANNNNMRTQRDRNDGLRTDDCCHKTLLKKYVILCLICGGLSVLVGCLFIVIYFLFRSYTSSLQYFETIPTYIPSLMVMIFYYKDFIIFIH